MPTHQIVKTTIQKKQNIVRFWKLDTNFGVYDGGGASRGIMHWAVQIILNWLLRQQLSLFLSKRLWQEWPTRAVDPFHPNVHNLSNIGVQLFEFAFLRMFRANHLHTRCYGLIPAYQLLTVIQKVPCMSLGADIEINEEARIIQFISSSKGRPQILTSHSST